MKLQKYLDKFNKLPKPNEFYLWIVQDHLIESEELKNKDYYGMLEIMELLMKKGITVEDIIKEFNI